MTRLTASMKNDIPFRSPVDLARQLEHWASRCPAKPAVLYGDCCLNYAALRAATLRLASYLTSAGLTKGDRVGLLLDKTPEAVISFLGVAAAGGIVFPLDYNQRIADMQYTLDLTRPAVLIVGARFISRLAELRLPQSDTKIIVIGQAPVDSFISWDTIQTNHDPTPPEIKLAVDDPVYLNFTSGTTGTPKGAVTTHANIYWNTRSAVEALNLTSDDVHLCMFPVFGHPHELFARALLLGGAIVLLDSVSPREIARTINKHQVTCMMATASIYLNLCQFSQSCRIDLSSLRQAESGGMHITPAMAASLKQRLALPLLPVWGSTETTGIALANRPGQEYRPGSAGRPCPYYDIEIRDEQGKPVAIGEIGEMFIKGPGVCRSYFENKEETLKHMQNGGALTGDLFLRDKDDYFYFAGRASRMIKSAGLKIYPAEIENVIGSHPDVAEVAVTACADSTRGEVPRAVIVLNPGCNISDQIIRKYCEKRLANYKIPRKIDFVEDLPKTQGGKILYNSL